MFSSYETETLHLLMQIIVIFIYFLKTVKSFVKLKLQKKIEKLFDKPTITKAEDLLHYLSSLSNKISDNH